MRPAPLAISTAVLALALAGCTGTQDGSAGHPTHSTPVVAGPSHSVEEGQDLGNGRPAVHYDGLMVRRRVVIAVHSGMEADLEGIRAKLDNAATPQGLALDTIPPTVLEPAVLEHVMPELTVVLPPGATLENAEAVADQASADGAAALGAEHFHVQQVLVHDLQFDISTAGTDGLSAEVDREGILSDYLGNYQTASRDGHLSFNYTGPLLSDDTVEDVRQAIARPAHTAAQSISVGPRSTAGAGVDMDQEPPWAPEVLEATGNHVH